jgi:hypothetical protein
MQAEMATRHLPAQAVATQDAADAGCVRIGNRLARSEVGEQFPIAPVLGT